MENLKLEYLYGATSVGELEAQPKCVSCGHPRGAHVRRGHSPWPGTAHTNGSVCACGAGLRHSCLICATENGPCSSLPWDEFPDFNE